MRLINADALLTHAWDADTRCGYVQVVDVGDIEDAPTIDAFVCPVKPGQTVYQPNEEDGAIYECKVEYIVFVDGGWTANCTNTLGFDADALGELIFPTREAAEKRLEEKRGVKSDDGL